VKIIIFQHKTHRKVNIYSVWKPVIQNVACIVW